MKRAFVIVMLSIAMVVVWAATLVVIAQEKPPQLSSDSRIAILKAQLKQKQLESQFLALQQQVANMQQQMTKLQGEYTEGGKSLQDAIDAAYKSGKLDRKDWNLDLDKLEFTAIPKSIAPAAPQTVGSQEPKKP